MGRMRFVKIGPFSELSEFSKNHELSLEISNLDFLGLLGEFFHMN